MSLGFPRDLVFEMFLSRWVNITALPESWGLRQVEPVNIEWGSKSEQLGKVPPSTAEGVLNNGTSGGVSGPWTQENPYSPYAEHLRGRNVPTRLGLRVSKDGFGNRTLPTTWGTSESGDVWNPDGGTYSVGSGTGNMVLDITNFFQVITIADGYSDCCVAASCTVNVNDVTGGDIEPGNLVLRYQTSGPATGQHYLLRVAVTSSEAVTIKIVHSFNGDLSGSVTVPGLADAISAKQLRAKFQIEGHMLRGKVYRKGTSADPDEFEPLGWHVSAQDSTLSGGRIGIRCGVALGNTNIPVTFQCDDWEARLMRHTGELVKLQPKWDPSHRIKTARFKLADITQRLGRPERAALSSAPRRYLAGNNEFTVTDHWPLDELPNEPTQGLNAVAGGDPAQFFRDTSGAITKGGVKWGETDEVLTSVPGFVALNNGGRLVCPVRSATLSLGWSVMVAVRQSSDNIVRIQFGTLSNPFHLQLVIFTDGGYELLGDPGAVSLTTGSLRPAGVDGDWVTLGLTTFFNGGTNLGFHINQDGQTLGVGNWATGGFSALSQIRLIVANPVNPITGQQLGFGSAYFSSLFVTPQRFDTIISGTSISNGSRASNVIKGWPGDSALGRAFRLCAEEGIPFDYWGGVNDTRKMGPQRPIPLLDQLQECADLDGGVLYGPRYTPGVAIRFRRSMVARPADVTLSYSAGQVAPTTEPSADDRHTANLIRTSRINGASIVVEQTSGPMNTNDPGTSPDAVGVVPATSTTNAESDALLNDVGSWVRAIGTVPEVRYPRFSVNLRSKELNDAPGLEVARSMLALHPGDRALITGAQAADIYRDLDQIVRGGSETYRNVRSHQLSINTAPYDPYRAGVYGESASRFDSATTTLDAQLNSGVTGARNVTVTAGEIWTTRAADFPQDVWVGSPGERVTLSGVTGTGPGQVMTISARGVNGVNKTWPAGTRVYLLQPVRHC